MAVSRILGVVLGLWSKVLMLDYWQQANRALLRFLFYVMSFRLLGQVSFVLRRFWELKGSSLRVILQPWLTGYCRGYHTSSRLTLCSMISIYSSSYSYGVHPTLTRRQIAWLTGLFLLLFSVQALGSRGIHACKASGLFCIWYYRLDSYQSDAIAYLYTIMIKKASNISLGLTF